MDGNKEVMFNVSLNSDSDGEHKSDFGILKQPEESSITLPTIDDNELENTRTLDETTEKTRLICQILELQNTLEDLSQRVDSVKEENIKLKSENEVLGKYIENLMATSSVFQNTDAKGKAKLK